jgi:hypothetical protein
MCRSVERRWAGDAESVTLGRHFVSATLIGWGVVEGDPAWEVLADLLLVATELLSRSVTEGAGAVLLRVDAHRTRIRLSVSYAEAGPSAPPGAARAPETELRGTAIVKALAARSGQSSAGGSAERWADIALGEGSVLAADCRE